MPKFLGNNYENFLLSGIFGQIFITKKKVKLHVQRHTNQKGIRH